MIAPGTIIGLDFDGTCVAHEFPKVGKELPYCVDTLKKIVAAGGLIILWTMRSNHTVDPITSSPEIHAKKGMYLDDAVNWFKKRDIPLWGIQTNPDQKSWTSSPKAYAHIYIDDAALGSFTMQDTAFSDRPYIDWALVDTFLFPEKD